MRGLLVVDEKNELAAPAAEVVERVREHVSEARRQQHPIAWLRHHDELGEKADWLRSLGVTEILIVGFYAHALVSSVARDALFRGFAVSVDPDAIAGRAIEHPTLGSQTADDVRLSALLHLTSLGVTIATLPEKAIYLDWLDGRRQERARTW